MLHFLGGDVSIYHEIIYLIWCPNFFVSAATFFRPRIQMLMNQNSKNCVYMHVFVI